MESIDNLIAYLAQISPISKTLESKLKSLLTEVTYEKNQAILKIGDICKFLYFLELGFAKGIRKRYEKEVTTWFWKEMDVMTSIDSFLKQTPSEEGILALENCKALQLSYHDLQDLYKEFIEFNIVGRVIIESYFLKSGEITTALRDLNAEQKYNYLLSLHPDIFQRTTLHNISSYLGLTPETISRVRARHLIS